MKNKFILLLTMMLLFALGTTPLKAQYQVLTVCDGASTNSFLPVYGYYLDNQQRVQTLYPANLLSDMQGASITKMTFYSYTASTAWTRNFNVSLATTTSTLSSGFLSPTFTQVYTGNLRVSGSQLVVTFTDPFEYAGDNLLIQFDYPIAGSYVSAYFYGQTQSSVGGRVQYGNNYNTSTSNNFPSFLPKVTFEYEYVTCARPSNFTASNITSTGANLAWTAGGTETQWEVEYGAGNFTPGTGTRVIVNTNSYALTGLDGRVTYTAYVRGICGAGDTSSTVSTTFTTLQIPATMPYFCGFEDANENNQWTLANNPTNGWYIGSARRYNGTNALYISNDNGVHNAYTVGSNAGYVWAYRDIQISSANELLVDFDWHCFGESSWDYMSVYVGDPVEVTPLAQATKPMPPAGANTVTLLNPLRTDANTSYFNGTNGADTSWHHFSGNIPASFANTTKRIYFVWYNDASGGNQPPVCVDNIQIAGYNCTKVKDFTLVTFNDNSATLKWTPDSTSNAAFEIVYDTVDNDDPELVGTPIALTDTFYNMTGLTSLTQYYVYVRAVCGSEYSGWTKLVFKTSQVPLVVPFTETFENDTDNANWDFANNTNLRFPNNWYIGDAANNGGLKSLYISNNSGATNAYTTASATATVWAYRDIYFTPANEYELNFDWQCAGQSGQDYFRVYIGTLSEVSALTTTSITTPAGATVLNNPEPANTTYPSHFNQSSTWKTTKFDLPKAYAGGTYRLYFAWVNNATTGTQPPAAIDNVSIISRNCSKVQNLATISANDQSIVVNWRPGADENSFEVVYSVDADFNPDSILTPLAVTDTFVTITGLAPLTTYYIYVRAVCGDEYGAWTLQPLEVATSQTPLVVPFVETFENAADNALWQFASNTNMTTYPNAWYIGSARNHGGLQSLYISQDGGVNNTYKINSTHMVWAYRDVYFPTAGDYTVSFDWHCAGESSSDYMYAFIGDLTTPIASTSSGTPSLSGVSYYQFKNPLRNSNYFNGYSASYTMTDTAWNHFEVLLTPELCNEYAGTTKRVYFAWKNDASSGTQPPMAIDNFAIDASSCLAVDSLSVDSNTTTTSATVKWVPRGNESAWIIEYRLIGETTWAQVNVTTNTFTLTGLQPSSGYEFRVMADCGDDDLSVPSVVKEFYTECASITTFPWTYGFETTWKTQGAPSDKSAPYCWYNLDGQSSSYYWQRTTTANNVFDGSAAAYFYGTSAAATANGDYLVMPLIEFDATPKQIRFYAKKAGASYHPKLTLCASTFNGTNFQTPWMPISTILVDDINYSEYTVSLADLQNIDYLYIAFARIDSGNYSIYLDNIVIEDIPACPKPTAITFTGTTHEQTTASWTYMNASTNAEYVISTNANADPDTLTPVAVTGNSTLITGLSLRTTYYIWVRTNCTGNYSDWNTASFSTTGILAQVPYYCDFEDATEAIQWETFNGTSTNNWIVGTAESNSPTHSLYVSNDGSSFAYSNTLGTIWAYRDINFPTGATSFEISFDWKCVGEPSAYDYMKVFIGDPITLTTSTTLPNGPASATSLTTSNMLGQSTWTNLTYSLNASYAGTTKRLYFGWINDGSTTSTPAAVDNISITAIYCSTPTALTVPAASITSNSAVLTWTAADAETSWLVEYRPSNSATWLRDTVTTTTHTLTGLNVATNYQVRVYAICPSGDGLSAATAITSFSTACDVITNLPYYYDFEDTWVTCGTRLAPPCWDRNDDGDSYYWYRSPSTGVGGSVGTYFYGTTTSSTSYNDYIMSPEIQLTGNERMSIYLYKATASYSPKVGIYLFTDPTDITSAVLVQTISNLTTSYAEYVVDLSAYSGIYRIALGRTDNGNGNVYADNFLVEAIPACEKPLALRLQNVSGSSATISWTAGDSNVTDYMIAYSTVQNFNPDTCQNVIQLNTTATTYTFPQGTFMPLTTYYVYVKALCGSDTSIWTLSPLSFTTSQIAFVAPGVIDFEDATENANWQFANNASGNKWYIGSAANNGGSNSLYISNDNGVSNEYSNTASVVWAYRDIDFSTIGDYELSFDWKCYGESHSDYMRAFIGYISTVTAVSGTTLTVPANTTQILNELRSSYQTYFNGYDGSNYEDEISWHTTTFSIPTEYVGTTKRIYFAWRNDGSIDNQPPIAIDNINITVNMCALVDSLRVIDSTITTTGATIQWHARGSETAWNVEYAPTGSDAWTPVTANTNPFTLTNLAPSSTYQLRVRANCGGSDLSAPSAIVTFSTQCDIITTIPWSYNFEETWITNGTLTAPYCWNNVHNGDTYNWRYAATSGIGNSGATRFYGSTSTTTQNNDWLVTPTFALTGNEQATFFSRLRSASYSPVLSIYAVPNTVGMTTQMLDTTAIFIDTLRLTSETFEEFSVDLSAFTGDYALAFVRKDKGNDDIYIDNLTIEPLPTCRRPSNLTVSNVSGTEALLSWTAGDPDAQGYTIAYSTTPNFNPDSASVTTYVTITDTTADLLIGLMPTTAYSAYVKTHCGGGDESNWCTLPVSFTTTQIPLTVPFVEDFEDTTMNQQWQIVNNPTGNAWYIGNAVNHGGENSLFVSADGGVTNDFENDSYCNVWAYRDIYFTPAGEYTLSFDWQCGGTQYYDYMSVYIGDFATVSANNSYSVTVPTGTSAIINELQTNSTYQRHFNAHDGTGYNVTGWNTTTVNLDGSYSGKMQRIYFVWHVDSYTIGMQPGAAVDNISIQPINCSRPTAVNFVAADTSSATVNWTPAFDESEFEVVYDIDPDVFIDTITTNRFILTDTVITFTGLQPSTTYTMFIRAICGENLTSQWSAPFTFSTTQRPEVAPFVCNFEDTIANAQWQFANNASGNNWYIGGAVNYGGSNALYISNNDGVSNAYNTSNSCIVWAYRDITFPVIGDYALSFDWRCTGETTYDYMHAYFGNIDAVTAIDEMENPSQPAGTIQLLNGTSYYFNQSNNTWKHFEARLGNLAGTTKRLYFVWRNDASMGTQPPIAIDNIIVSVNTCLTPDTIFVTNDNITSTTALVEWADTTATDWIIYYKPTSGTAWTSVATTSPSYMMTGLQAATSYDVRVQATCGGGDTSHFTQTVTFFTECDVINLPWTYDFEDNWLGDTYPERAPLCWKQINLTSSTSYYWTRNATSGMNSSGCAVFAGPYNTTTQNNNWLVTPYLNFSGNDRVKFWAKRASTSYQPVISIYAMTDQEGVFNAIFIDTISPTLTSYKEYEVPVTMLNGTYVLAFVREDVGGANAYLDDLLVEPIPDCERPINVTSTAATQTSVTITWGAVDEDATGYVIAYSTDPNFDPDTATNTITVGNVVTHTLTGLMPSRTYYIYVKTICDGSDESLWSVNVLAAQTAQIPLEAPFVVDFEDATEAANWQIQNFAGVNQWIVGTATSTSPTHALYISDDGSAYHSDMFADGYVWAYRDIYFPTGYSSFELSFNWKCESTEEYDYWSYDSYYLDGMSVFIGAPQQITSNTITPAGATRLTNELYGQSDWDVFTTTFPASYAGTTQRLYFLWDNYGAEYDDYGYVEQSYGDPGAIDDITITGVCPDVTNVTVVPDSTTAVVTWVSTATDFEVVYGPAGFTDFGGTVIPVTATTYTIVGLTPNTAYDVYVYAICGTQRSEGDMATFTTLEGGEDPGPGPGPGPGPDEPDEPGDTTSIRDIDLTSCVALAPIPTRDNLYVKTSHTFSQVEILNNVGQIIYRAEVTENNFVLDVAPYSAGIYFLRLSSSEGMVTKRFVKN